MWSIDIAELHELPLAEKRRIFELLWDDISASNKPIELRRGQFQEAARRSAELQAAPSIAINRDELRRRVAG